MRIIAGKFKGRKLVAFKADHIRPTTDRVKETIFNKLYGYFDGARVLDLFSGTGNLSMESLSRGADSVVCVEKNKKSVQIIKKNQELLGVTGQVKIVNQDVSRYLKTYTEPFFDVILIDPPFTEKMAHDVMLELTASSVYGVGTRIVIESSKQERIDDDYQGVKLLDRKGFGDKVVSFFVGVDDVRGGE